MDAETSKTARTAIYVVGGLVALTTVAGIVIFVTTASTAKSMAASGSSAVQSPASSIPMLRKMAGG